MSNSWYNTLPTLLGNGNLDWDDNSTLTIKMLLLRSTGSYVFDPDHATVSVILAASAVEITVASYLRQEVDGRTVSQDDTNNVAKYDCNNVGFGALESGQTVSAAIMYKEVTTDADSIPLFFIDGKMDIVAAAPVVAAATGSITSPGITNANPGVVTSNAHGLSNGDKVKITSVVGMTEVNGNVYTVANVDTNTFELSGTDTSTYGTYSSGGTWTKVMTVYTEILRSSFASGVSVDFGGGATGTLNAAASKNARYVEVNDLAAAIDAGDKSSDVQTILNLPAALGGGDFNVNISANGLFLLFRRP